MKWNRGFLNIYNVLLLLAILVALNVLANRTFLRWDVSEGQMFTLSKYSRQVVADLSDPVTVKAYFSRNLGQHNNVRQYVKDKLADYRSYSHGMFNFELIDPGDEDDELLRQEAAGHGIRPIQMQTLENDKMEVKLVWMGLVFIYGDKKETIPVVQQVDNLEYDITSLIRRLTETSPTRIGILQGHGEPALAERLSLFDQVMSKNYYLESVDLTRVHHIDTGLQALLMIAPTEPYTAGDRALLDEYFMSGGRIGIFTNSVIADIQTQQGKPRDPGLEQLLNSWGVRVDNNLIMDQQSGMVQVRMGGQGLASMFPVSMQYPFFPRVTGFNRELSISKGIETAQLFYPSSIDTSLAGQAGVKVEPFAWSSPNTQVVRDRYQLGIRQQYTPQDFPDGRQLFGVALSGSFPSAVHDPALLDSMSITMPDASPENRLAVCGDGSFLMNDFLGQRQLGNLELAQNIVDWLVQDEGLINIRSRVVTDRPLKEIAPGSRKVIRWMNILGAPLLLVLFGLIRWQMKRKRRNQEL